MAASAAALLQCADVLRRRMACVACSDDLEYTHILINLPLMLRPYGHSSGQMYHHGFPESHACTRVLLSK